MATSDGAGLKAELLPERRGDIHARNPGVAIAAVKWAVWLPMCVLLGIHVAMLVVWPSEKMRTPVLLMAVQKFGFSGRSCNFLRRMHNFLNDGSRGYDLVVWDFNCVVNSSLLVEFLYHFNLLACRRYFATVCWAFSSPHGIFNNKLGGQQAHCSHKVRILSTSLQWNSLGFVGRSLYGT